MVAASTQPVPLRLPGQAAARPGAVDVAVMYLMHHGIRRDLTAFVAAAHATPVGDREVWQTLGERWAFFAAVLHHHHRSEYAGLWPALLQGSDADARALLRDMAAEHAGIESILERCAAGFRRLAAGPEVDVRIALAEDLEAAKVTLGRHLDHEETDVIAIVQEVLTASEWAVIEEQYFTGSVARREVLSLVPWMLHDLPAVTRREVLARAGAGRRMIWTIAHGAFERREHRAFRYLD